MIERYLTPVSYSNVPVEVIVDHWFVAHGKRYAVVYREHHGEPIHEVREEKHLTPVTHAEAA